MSIGKKSNPTLLFVAQVLLYGGQVVSWKNEKREEMLFTSNKVNLIDNLAYN